MKFLRSLTILSVVFCCCFSFVQAKSLAERLRDNEVTVTKLKTSVSQPLELYIYPFASNTPQKLTGEIRGKNYQKKPTYVRFALKNQSGNLIWTERRAIEARKQNAQNFQFPIEIDFSVKKIVGVYEFSAEILTAEEDLIASSGRTVTLQANENSVGFMRSSIRNIQITDSPGEKKLIQVEFSNAGDAGSFLAYFSLYEDKPNGAKITVEQSSVQALTAKGNGFFSAEIQAPVTPQRYRVDIEVRDQTQTLVTGIASKTFQIAGDFAEIIKTEVTPPQAWRSGDLITVSFNGRVVDRKKPLKLAAVFRDRTGEVAAESLLFETEQDIAIDEYSEFRGKISFVAPWSVDQVFGAFELFQGGNLVGAFQFASKNYATKSSILDGAEAVIDTIFLENNFSLMQKMFLGGGLILFIVGIIFFIRFIIRMRRGNALMWFIGMFLFGMTSTVSAAGTEMGCVNPTDTNNRHCQLFSVETYTSNPLTAENEFFRQIPMLGTVQDAQGGIFLGDGATSIDTAVLVQKPDSSTAFVNGASLTTTYTNVYNFTVPLDGGEFSAEGTYTILSIFFENGLRADLGGAVIQLDFGVGAEPSFTIDNDSPVIEYFLQSDLGGTELRRLEGSASYDVASYPALSAIASPQASDVQAYMTNQSVYLNIQCQDDDCFFNNGASTNYAEFPVTGNFCDDDTICSDTGARAFRLCDGVANCAEPTLAGPNQEVVLKNFDNQGPSFASFDFVPSVDPSYQVIASASNTVKADDDYDFTVSALRDVSQFDDTGNTIDSHACGPALTSPFFVKTEGGLNFCSQKAVSCALSATARGTKLLFDDGTGAEIPEIDQVCNVSCGPGFLLVDINGSPNAPAEDLLYCQRECQNIFPLCFDFQAE